MTAVFISIFISIVLFAACNSGLSGEAHTIKMRLNKGDTFNHTIKMNMLMNTAVMGQSVNMNMKMESANSFEVMNADSLNKELKMTYNNLHMSMDMGKLNQAAVNTDSIMNSSTKGVIGKSVVFMLSKDNEIISTSGFDSLMTNESQSEASRQMIKKMFSKEQLNNLFGMMFSMYPGKPVKVGESWTSKTVVNIADIDMKVNVKYTLIGVKNGLADIDVDGVIDGKGEMNKSSGVPLEIAMSGTQKGTMTIKMTDGYLQNGAYKMDIKADMVVMGQKIPMTMKADYTLNGK